MSAIVDIHAREILIWETQLSKLMWSLKVELLDVRQCPRRLGGAFEAVELRDGDALRYGGKGVLDAEFRQHRDLSGSFRDGC